MARHSRGGDEEEREGRGRKEYIDALLTSRRPPPSSDKQLIARIEAKTAQHRSPFSANISRKHASILAAMSPPGSGKPRAGHKRSMTPTREATTRKAFEVFEWDRDFEPVEPTPPSVETPPEERHWDARPEPRPPVMKYAASLRGEEVPEVDDEAWDITTPPAIEEVPEAEDLIGEEMLEEMDRLATVEPVVHDMRPEPAPEWAPEPTPETPTQAPREVIVEGLPGTRPREGGEFPSDLMEPMDDMESQDVGMADEEAGSEEEEEPVLMYEHEMDISDETEVGPEETETDDALVGLAHSRRWPSDTGLELHIDGFEHMASASDLCPRCGRRITARNRMLTCTDCGTLACESCEMRTTAEVDAPYYYEWRFDLPLCTSCFDKAFNIQKALAKARAALGMGNHTYAFYHAQQALRTDPESPYAEEAQRIIGQVDRRRREAAEADERWKRERAKLSRTSIVHDG